MSRKQTLIKGTFILTFTGLISRVIGFYHRIFLSQYFGAEGVGLYQLIFPVYALCFAFTTAGIETAIARTVSAKVALNKHAEAKQFLLTSMAVSLTLSIIVSLGIHHYAEVISISFLGDNRTYNLILLLAYALPFGSIHGCIIGYYFGLKQTLVPSIAQLIEQIVRVASIYLLYQICINNEVNYSISLAVIGMIFGEIISTLFVVLWVTGPKVQLTKTKLTFQVFKRNLGTLLPLSTPLTANRVVLNILHSIEAVSIPKKLIAFGLSSSEALSTYGVLVGMALPCLLFPTAITSAVSTMLLPTVAEIQALNNKKEIKLVVRKTIQYCTFLGITCLIFFFLFADVIGTLMFHNDDVGAFLKVMAWLCPFLYLNTTLLSILNGMGKPILTFILNSFGLIIRIACVYFLIPTVGIYGYLWGMLISQIFITTGCYISFRRLCII